MDWDAWGVWLTYEVRCYVVAGVFVIGERGERPDLLVVSVNRKIPGLSKVGR